MALANESTGSIAIGRGNTLETLWEIHWPHSVGLLYSAFTYYTGFKVNSGRHLPATAEQENLFGIDKLNLLRSDIPAVTHVDYSARIQTVHVETNPRYHALISAFKRRTGCSVLVNTSFNVRGEPIVCRPEDAFQCFMGTEMEMLVIGKCFLRKEQQNASLRSNYSRAFELD